MIVALAFALLSLGIRAAVRLDTVLAWDTLFYHVPFAALRGGIPTTYSLNDIVQPMYDAFPPLPELVQGLLWRLSGSMNATGVASYLAFVLFLAYCHRFLRAPIWIVGLIALTAPLVLIHAAASYTDLFGNALLAMAIASALFIWLFPERMTWGVLAGALVGAVGAMWSKYVLVPTAGVFFVLLVVVAVCAVRVTAIPWRRMAAAFVLAAIVGAAPYAKNVGMFGNPFWPYRVPIPVLASLIPYQVDGLAGAAASQTPPPLAGTNGVVLFANSILEIGHPTSYTYRPRWLIDQGSGWLAFRMGGFWWVGVVAYVTMLVVMLALLHRRRGVIAAGAALATFAFVATLPESHELRYYLFLPLAWAAGVGMLHPELSQRFPRQAAGILVAVLLLFGYMAKENFVYYRPELVGFSETVARERMPVWWAQLERDRTYCVAGMMPIGILFTGPTLNEFRVVDRSKAALCPSGSTIITNAGIGMTAP